MGYSKDHNKKDGVSMCLSTVYIQSEDRRLKVMQDVAQMEYNQEGYLLIGLLGEQKLVKGVIRKIDFVDDHLVIIEAEKKEDANDTPD
jgi:predicted RNA-binding protein